MLQMPFLFQLLYEQFMQKYIGSSLFLQKRVIMLPKTFKLKRIKHRNIYSHIFGYSK